MRPVYKLLILLVVVVTTGCSKDKRIENSITKKEGVWNISSVTYTRVAQVVSGTNIGESISINKTESDIGSMTFDKDKSKVTFDFTLDGEHRNESYLYLVSDQDIIFSIDMNLGNLFDMLNSSSIKIEQKSVSYVGDQTSKNDMTVSGGEVYQQVTDTSVVQIVLTADFKLTR